MNGRGRGKDCGNIDIYESKQSPGEGNGGGCISSGGVRVCKHVSMCVIMFTNASVRAFVCLSGNIGSYIAPGPSSVLASIAA